MIMHLFPVHFYYHLSYILLQNTGSLYMYQIYVHTTYPCFMYVMYNDFERSNAACRSNLPDNLKQLFRPLAMTSPSGQLIAQVMLLSQGFRTDAGQQDRTLLQVRFCPFLCNLLPLFIWIKVSCTF